MDAYLEDLRRVMLYITAAGAAAPLAAFLLSRWAKRVRERLYPPVSVWANVITKRLEVKTKDSSKKTHTLYYITFLPDGGRRMEYAASADEYALSAPGDRGVLEVQMGKFKSFTRAML